MKKDAAVFIGLLIALSAAYDFWRGYRQTGDPAGGVVYVVLGFGVLGLLWLLMRRGSH